MKRKYEIAVLSKGGFARTVRIYAPKHADRAVIMHDGQNVFSDEEAAYGKSWRALDIIKSAGIKNTAIIGVDSTSTRYDDYLPFPSALSEYGMPEIGGGKAEVYFDFTEHILLPYLDKRFGFERYALVGSSAGAIATLCFALRKIPKITAYGLFSTPLFVTRDKYAELLSDAEFNGDASYLVYVGGNETEGDAPPEVVSNMYVDDAFAVVKSLRRGGARNVKLRLENDGVHDEISWRKPEAEFLKDFSKQ